MRKCTRCKLAKTIIYALVAMTLGTIVSLFAVHFPIKIRGLTCRCQRCKATYDCSGTHACYE